MNDKSISSVKIRSLRWVVLFIVSLVMAANYYFYDAMSPLQNLLREHLGFSNTAYGFLVSAYSIPNVFLLMAVIGGIILDKIGIRVTGLMFTSFMAIGSFLTAYGASDYFNDGGLGYHFMSTFLKSYSPAIKMMSLGFFLFGLGAETSIVVVSKVVVKWFKGKELAMALGLNIAVARMGTAMALFFSRSISTDYFWNRPIWFASSLLAIAVLTFIIYIFFDLRYDRIEKFSPSHSPDEEFRITDVFKLIRIPSFIYITLLCVTFYSAVFPFLKYATDMLENKFGLPGELSGRITSILPFGTIIFTPLFGWFTDVKGKSASVMILGSLILVMVHLTFTFTQLNPYLPMFMLGVAFSLVPAAMWPSVAKIVETSKIGTAYGFMFSVQNIGLWAFPFIIGFVLDVTNPFYRTVIKTSSFKEIAGNEFIYNGLYLKKSGEPNKDKSFKLKVSVIDTTDSMEEKVIWDESHDVHSDNSGKYSIVIGKPDEFLDVDIQRMRLTRDTFYCEIKKADKGSEKIVTREQIFINGDYSFSVSENIRNNISEDSDLEIIITDKDTGGTVIWAEVQKARELAVSDTVSLGKGKVIQADSDYFQWTPYNYYVSITVPLDYSRAVLILSFLGVAGLVFAFLLKREDRSSGFGLELPNKTE
jgi:MFS family permease